VGEKAGCTTHPDLRRGVVERHSGDGRAIYATITDGGRAALKAAAPGTGSKSDA
jgi:hypothetical protein